MPKNKRTYKNNSYNGEVVGIQAGYLPAIVAGRTDSRSPRPEPVPEVFLNIRYQTKEGPRYQRVATGSGSNGAAAQIVALLSFPTGSRVDYERVRDGEYAVSHQKMMSSIVGIEEARDKLNWEALTEAAQHLGLVETSSTEDPPALEIEVEAEDGEQEEQVTA